MSSEIRINSATLGLELEHILKSRVFERAQRSQRFLTYLVNAALADPPVTVKEYALAIDVFDRDTTYNPSIDATVRVEASRLRSRLRDYYANEGQAALWRIEIPKGSYSIATTFRTAAVETSPAPSRFPRQLRTILLALALLLLGAGGGWFSAWLSFSLETSNKNR